MKSAKLNTVYISLFLSLLILCSCSKSNNSPSPAQGGQDSGGGSSSISRKIIIDDEIRNEAHLKLIIARGAASLRASFFATDSTNYLQAPYLLRKRPAPSSNQIDIKIQRKFIDHYFGKDQNLTEWKESDPLVPWITYLSFLEKPSSFSNIDTNVCFELLEPRFNFKNISPWQNAPLWPCFDKVAKILEDQNNRPYRYEIDKGILSKIKINILENSYCTDLHKNYKTASVNKFDLSGGEICISKLALKEIPESSLSLEIMALLIHEMSHLLGFNEADALELQKYILNNFEVEDSNLSSLHKSITSNFYWLDRTISYFKHSFDKNAFCSNKNITEIKSFKTNEVHKEIPGAISFLMDMNMLYYNLNDPLNIFVEKLRIAKLKTNLAFESQLYEAKEKVLYIYELDKITSLLSSEQPTSKTECEFYYDRFLYLGERFRSFSQKDINYEF